MIKLKWVRFLLGLVVLLSLAVGINFGVFATTAFDNEVKDKIYPHRYLVSSDEIYPHGNIAAPIEIT